MPVLSQVLKLTWCSLTEGFAFAHLLHPDSSDIILLTAVPVLPSPGCLKDVPRDAELDFDGSVV